ncbi:TPA: glycosyltransferase family 2 protein, partial [Acinetobacter baumannii]|nr:glycosyltransferase family 2 protein [Acinetobacter baumannii]
ILLRQNMSQFLKGYCKTHPEANKAYRLNQKSLSIELRKNASLAIRRRYYDRIIPTSVIALQTLPFYVIPFYILKLLVQFIVSICLVAPYKMLLKQPK